MNDVENLRKLFGARAFKQGRVKTETTKHGE